nr:heat shock protein 90 [Allamanda chlorotic virus A]
MVVSDNDEFLLNCVFNKHDVQNEIREFANEFENKPHPSNFRWSEYFLYDYLKSKGMLNNYQGSINTFRQSTKKIVEQNYEEMRKRNFSDLSNVKGALIGHSHEDILTHAKTEAKGNIFLERIITACCESSGRLVSLSEIKDAINITKETKLERLKQDDNYGLSRRCKLASSLYVAYKIKSSDVDFSSKIIIYKQLMDGILKLLFPGSIIPDFDGLKPLLIGVIDSLRPQHNSYDDRTYWLQNSTENVTPSIKLLYGKVHKPLFDDVIACVPFIRGDDIPLSKNILTNKILMDGIVNRVSNIRLFLPEDIFQLLLTYIMNDVRESVQPIPTPKRMLSILLLFSIIQRTNKFRIVQYRNKFNVTFGRVVYYCDFGALMSKFEKFDSRFGNTFRRFVGSFASQARQLSTIKHLTQGNTIWKDMYDLPLSLNFDFAKFLNTSRLSEKERHFVTVLNKRFSKIK